MRNNKILVTGGAGFVGSHLADALIKKGYRVVVIDNFSSGKKKNLNPKARFFKIDIESPKILDIFKKEKPEAVFHYAAQIDVRKSTEEPVENAKVNILGALNILECCKIARVKKFIFSSSVGVYGEPKKLPVKENHPLNPISPYSVTKLAVEKYLNYYQSRGVDFVILRYSNIYGPRQSAEGEGGVAALFLNKIIKGESPVVFGNGNQTRDFLYVEDAVLAAVKSLGAKPGSIYNVATNKEISINELRKKIASGLKIKIIPIFSPRKSGEIYRSRADFSKIKKELGWKPKYTPDRGLKETTAYFKNEN